MKLATHDIIKVTHGLEKADRVIEVIEELSAEGQREQYTNILTDYAASRGSKNVRFDSLKSSYGLIAKPVGVEEFLTSPQYMNAGNVLYPEVLKELIEINSGKYEECIFTGGIGSGKLLDVDTEVPTPSGWTTMGQLKSGDRLYDQNGDICRVVVAHPVHYNEKCYQITFDDGTLVVAGGDHLWKVQTIKDRDNSSGAAEPSRIVDTEAMSRDYVTGKTSPRNKYSVYLAGAIEGQYFGSPVPPYVLGYWLGDGSKDKGVIHVGDEDVDAVEASLSDYYPVTRYAKTSCHRLGLPGLLAGLRKLGVVDNKHIPERFFRAEESQRWQLLQGLMDSDGTINKEKGRCTFSNTNPLLIKGVYDLAISLGLKARTFTQKRKVLKKTPEYAVQWVAPPEAPIFRLPRKQKYVGIIDAAGRSQKGQYMRRYIREIKEVSTRPLRCITVDSEEQLYLVTKSNLVTHNTTAALYTLAYTLYYLSLYKNPQGEFELDPASEIELVIQSATANLAKEVGYARVKSLIGQAPYFKQYFAPDPNITTQLNFPKNIKLKFLTGKDTAALGQNVYNGFIDEVNHMEKVEKSVKATSADETYNQADALYNSINTRRKSRFMVDGKLPGVLGLVGSRNYPGQFTDKKEDEMRGEINEYGHSRIYLYDKCTWHVKPWQFTNKWFRVFHGDATRRPRILRDDEIVADEDKHLVSKVPVEYKAEFKRDLIGSLSDIAGISTRTRSPYIINIEAVNHMFGRRKSILNFDYADFSQDQIVIKQGLIEDVNQPRAVHVDLAKTVDCAGVACGYVKRFLPVQLGKDIHYAPEIHYDFMLQVRPPPQEEINYAEIRRLILTLRDLGMPIMFFTADTYQSTDTLQIMRQYGLRVGELSLDKDTKPYDIFKTALLEGRLWAPEHDVCRDEIIGLELDREKGKIDHAPGGINSKDVSDAAAGVAACLSVQRLVWGLHNVSFMSAPPELRASAAKQLDNDARKK